MNHALIIFEDEKYVDFYPLTHLRPTYFLRPGIRFLFEKYVDVFSDYRHFLFCRPELVDIVSSQTTIPINKFEVGEYEATIFVNGRVKYNPEFITALEQAGKNVILYSGENIAAFKKVGKLNDDENEILKEGDLARFLDKLTMNAQTMEIELPMYNHLWDLVNAIETEIEDDFEYFKGRSDATGFLKSGEELKLEGKSIPGVELINPEKIRIAPSAELLPGIVLDATKGPIFIGDKARIEPLSYIIGPTYIGKETRVVGGKINGCSVGPVCRVGGELEETIVQGYSNKYHAGFIGHSYLGEWINLGAMTTNSDLKNNYANVKVSINGEKIDTGCLKVGSFIGDFTKTSIGTLLNTGINIGVGCNIISDGLVTDSEIGSFTWYSPRHKMDYNFVKAIGTIEKTMTRRGVELSGALKARLDELSRASATKRA
jgi:UDP-N-acetylglucosamine diphosphorylase / glucose-1-phosphate thymidylyltransferase / UDP-N-acetylgalactosamine diphosphorylase / glucosamine-1-phosphate N-acetyltransferase / galactosamine-1-phosphate N-acetyltransferase